MSDLLLDVDTWDLAIVDGDLVFIDEKEDLALQSVLMTLRTYRGEWYKNINYGVPWIENENNRVAILGKTPKAVFDSYIRTAILSNEEVVSIINYKSSMEPLEGKVTVEARLEIESGFIEFSEEI